MCPICSLSVSFVLCCKQGCVSINSFPGKKTPCERCPSPPPRHLLPEIPKCRLLLAPRNWSPPLPRVSLSQTSQLPRRANPTRKWTRRSKTNLQTMPLLLLMPTCSLEHPPNTLDARTAKRKRRSAKATGSLLDANRWLRVKCQLPSGFSSPTQTN